MITVHINKQALRVTAPVMVSGTRNYFSAEFHFSPEWDGLSKTAYFRQGDTLYKSDLISNRLDPGTFPDLGAGDWEFCVWGLDTAGHQRITTDTYMLHVEQGGVIEESQATP